MRSFSERFDGSRFFFLGFRIRLMVNDKWKEKEAYLESIACILVDRPVVVDVETDQAQNGNVEQNLPAWHDAAAVVHPFSPPKL